MFKKKMREFIVDEKDVTAVITVINKHRRYADMSVGNCGWAEEPEKWFIIFHEYDKVYGQIVDELNKIGTFRLNVSPSFTEVELYFERAH